MGSYYRLYLLDDDKHSYDYVERCLSSCLAYPKTQIQSLVTITDSAGKSVLIDSGSKETTTQVQDILGKFGLETEITEITRFGTNDEI